MMRIVKRHPQDQQKISGLCRKQLFDKAETALFKTSRLLKAVLRSGSWLCLRRQSRDIYQCIDRKSLQQVNIHLKCSLDGASDVLVKTNQGSKVKIMF